MAYAQAGRAQETQKREVGLLLGFGILACPFIFVWFLLRPGYSDRARIIAFGWVTALMALSIIFGGKQSTPASPVQEVAQADENQSDPKAVAASNAEENLNNMQPSDGEDYRAFNGRVTKAYNQWAAAEQAYRGDAWKDHYTKSSFNDAYYDCVHVAERAGARKQGFLESLSGTPSEADKFCQMRGLTPTATNTVRTLDSYLLAAPVESAMPVEDVSQGVDQDGTASVEPIPAEESPEMIEIQARAAAARAGIAKECAQSEAATGTINQSVACVSARAWLKTANQPQQ